MKKYRAWDKKNNEYWDFDKKRDGVIEGYLVLDGDGKLYMALVCGLDDFSIRDRFEIEFSTGRIDDNKKELYQGDIVQDDDEGILYQVVWAEDWMGFYFKDTDGDFLHADDLYYLDGKAGFDIIGNIHENEELWK